MAEELKPLKKQQQIEQDEKFARELEAELNKNIDWDEAIDHVNKKAKKDNAVKRYQAMKRKPQTEAQARKNMMVYLKNVVGFKMDYFKGMSYDDIRPILRDTLTQIETITAASTNITAAKAQVPAVTLTAAPVKVTAAPSRRRKGVVIRDP
nr:hypothetical protein [Tanacetum cinerariifolium]